MDMHDDILQDITGFDNEEEDTEDIISRICDEAQIQLAFDLPSTVHVKRLVGDLPSVPSAPPTRPRGGDGTGDGGPGSDDPSDSAQATSASLTDLQQRIRALRSS
jgi:hypothetical protein